MSPKNKVSYKSLEQFVPQEFCLKCRGCCRFKEADSVWSPCLLEEEVQDFLDKKDIPAASISIQRRLQPVPSADAKEFLCPFLETSGNRCQVYANRPFECRLYPFLINVRNGRVLLTVDLNCPYIYENINTQQAKDYIAYLARLLNSAPLRTLLKENPQLIQAYEEVREVAELILPDETK